MNTKASTLVGARAVTIAEIAATADRMCRIARRIIRECGVTVIFASHVALNGGGDDPRGSGGYLGDVDFALGMKKNEAG